MGRILLNWENIDKYSSIPISYRFVDKVEVIPGKEAWGKKLVSTLDWFFPVHFPGNPIMPGVFLMEVMQQTGALIVMTLPERNVDTLFFHACESMRMYRSVRPGDMLTAHVVLESFMNGIAKFDGGINAFDDEEKTDKLVCTMKFTLIPRKEILSKAIRILETGCQFNAEATEGIVFDWRNMESFTNDPVGYRFVDKVKVVSEDTAWGEKHVSQAEWYFSLLDRDDLMMPSAFVLESIMQTCVFAVNFKEKGTSTLLLFNGCQEVLFNRIVRPGERLTTYGQVKRTRNGVSVCSGLAAVGDEQVCTMKFTLVSPESLVKVRPLG